MSQPHIVVLGAGFGGLEAVKCLASSGARITLIDRNNHHLFQPLLYQVATAGLSATEIAHPIRAIFSNDPNVNVLLDEVVGINPDARVVATRQSKLHYDYLILALGARTSYFGHDEWKTHTMGLKTLEDALEVRQRILLSLEKAETENDAEEQKRLMTIAIIGGGPTGVELAGAFAELSRHVLSKDFRRIDSKQVRVLLIEAGARLLHVFPEDLSNAALNDLKRLGVEVRLQSKVQHIGDGFIKINGDTIYTKNIIWAAGVEAPPLTRSLGVPVDRVGRIMVEPDLSLPNHPNVFAIGDIISIQQRNGTPVPGVSPAAIQMGKYVARILRNKLESKSSHVEPFHYHDKGSMATIGRSSAVAYFHKLHLKGFAAWLMWLLVHLFFLIGFRNKLAVMIEWAYAYIAYRRGARIIFGGTLESPIKSQSSSVVS